MGPGSSLRAPPPRLPLRRALLSLHGALQLRRALDRDRDGRAGGGADLDDSTAATAAAANDGGASERAADDAGGPPREQDRLHVVWSETTAQHFAGQWGGAGGEYTTAHECAPTSDPESCHPADSLCVPRGGGGAAAVGRMPQNAAAEAVLERLGLRGRIAVLPIERLTAPRWDLHDESTVATFRFDARSGALHFRMDCTHQVYSPAYYAPQWHALFAALSGATRPPDGMGRTRPPWAAGGANAGVGVVAARRGRRKGR